MPLYTPRRFDTVYEATATAQGPGVVNETQLASVTVPAQGFPWRAYVHGSQYVSTTLATDLWQYRLRLTSLAGTLLRQWVAGGTSPVMLSARYHADIAPDAAATFVASIARNAGTGTCQTFVDASTSYLCAEVVPIG